MCRSDPHSAPLHEVFAEAEPGDGPVITRYRGRNQNLRTQLNRIIRKAGLQPWPKLFQNLRSTRETELAESFPLHVVTAWIGNSQPVAAKHSLQITDDHFARAVENPAQNPAQQTAAERSKGLQTTRETVFVSADNGAEKADLQNCADARNPLQDNPVGDEGIEHPPLALSKPPISSSHDAKSGAPGAPNAIQDPDLAQIVAAWPKLPEHIKAAILTLVRADGDR